MANSAPPKWVQPTVDYLGLIAFAGAYVISRMTGKGDLLFASWGLAIGSAAGLALGLIVLKKLPILPLFTGVSAIVFASLALIFHDTIFIKIKLTIIDGILACSLLAGQAMGKAPLKALLGGQLNMSDATWGKLTVRYAAFFVLVAVCNEVIWRSAAAHHLFTEGNWVFFRFPGVPILAVIFSFTQVPLMMKDMEAQEAAASEAETQAEADALVPPSN